MLALGEIRLPLDTSYMVGHKILVTITESCSQGKSISTTWLMVGLSSLSSFTHCRATQTKISILPMSYCPSNIGSMIYSSEEVFAATLFIIFLTHITSLLWSASPPSSTSGTLLDGHFPVTISNTTIP